MDTFLNLDVVILFIVYSTMGIKSAKKVTLNIKDLSMKGTKDIIDYVCRLDEQIQGGMLEGAEPTSSSKRIDVDCNYIACKEGGMKKPEEATIKTADILVCLANYGFIVTPICDGSIRHHSKRASMERISKGEQNRIKYSVARLQLLATTQQLRDNNNLNDQQKQELQNRQTELNKLVSSLENKSNENALPPSFAIDLQIELELRGAHETNDNMGRVEQVKVGLFQADPLIAKRARQNKSDIIMASDTDFFVTVGRQCLLLKDYKLTRARGRQRGNTALMEL